MISIFVAKLDFGVDNAKLRSLFESYGKVNKATVAMDKETGRSRGFGFVEMESESEGQAAIDGLDGFQINGRSIAVKKAEDRSDNRGGTSFNRSEAPRKTEGYQPEPKKSSDDGFVAPAFDPSALDNRKKILPKEKDRKSDNDIDRSKKPKMDAYRKSGKKDRFFDDEDDDDLSGSLFAFSDEDED
jgi:RNA recognition motif-containing protein